MEYIITKEQLEVLTEKVKTQKISEGTVSIKNPNYTLTAKGDGWLRDSRGATMCVKVEAGWPVGTFAQGIKNIYKKDEGVVIEPTGSKIGNIDMSLYQIQELAKSVLNNKPYTFTKSGSKITIGANLAEFCKKEWSS